MRMRFPVAALLAFGLTGPAWAAPSFTCSIEVVCAQIEPCTDHERESSTPLRIFGGEEDSIILDFGHRTAEFDRISQLDNDAIFAQSLDQTPGMQEMLTFMPTGTFLLTSHHNQDIGISITAFGTCEVDK